jgi:hypothetical protein
MRCKKIAYFFRAFFRDEISLECKRGAPNVERRICERNLCIIKLSCPKCRPRLESKHACG